jgi:hypothetical protein
MLSVLSGKVFIVYVVTPLKRIKYVYSMYCMRRDVVERRTTYVKEKVIRTLYTTSMHYCI